MIIGLGSGFLAGIVGAIIGIIAVEVIGLTPGVYEYLRNR